MRNFMKIVFVVLSLLFFCREMVAQEVDSDSGEQRSVDVPFENAVASFGDVNEKGVVVWYGESHVSFRDVIWRIQYCEHDRLAFCISSPYPIFLPKVGKMEEIKMFGTDYEVTLLPWGGSKLIGVCESQGFWLKVRDLDRKADKWYLFGRSEGLLEFIFFANEDSAEQIPVLALQRSSGQIFTLDDLCKPNASDESR